MNQHNKNDSLFNRIDKIEAELLEQEHRPFKLIWNFWNRKKKYEANDPRRKAVSKAIIWRLFISPTTIAIAFSGSIGFASLFFLWRQTEILKNQNTLIKQQTELSEASRRSSQMILLDGVLKDINTELNKNKKISNNLSSRIISLSHMIKPYRYYDYQIDSISKILSPERSQLLHSIIGSKLNDTYLCNVLFLETNFMYSDLNGLFLYDKYLQNVNLRYSSLEGTLLHNSNLINVDLRNSNIKGAGLPNAIMTRIDLRDAILDDVNLFNANLSSSDLRNTKFKNLNLGNIKSLHGAKVHRKDWFVFLQNSSSVEGIDKLKSKYRVISFYDKNIDDKVFTIVQK